MEFETRKKNLITEGSDVIEDRLTQPQISDGQAGQVSEQVIDLNQPENVEMATGPRNGKIKTIQELAEVLKSHRAKNKKIVHCHGVFDLLHIGHIRYFEQACQMGDILVVRSPCSYT